MRLYARQLRGVGDIVGRHKVSQDHGGLPWKLFVILGWILYIPHTLTAVLTHKMVQLIAVCLITEVHAYEIS